MKKTMNTVWTIMLILGMVLELALGTALMEENTVQLNVSIGDELRQYIDEHGLGMPMYKAEIGVTPKLEFVDYQPGYVYDCVLYIYSDGMTVGGVYARRCELMDIAYEQLMPCEYLVDMYTAGDWLYENIDRDLWECVSCEIHEVYEGNYLTD